MGALRQQVVVLSSDAPKLRFLAAIARFSLRYLDCCLPRLSAGWNSRTPCEVVFWGRRNQSATLYFFFAAAPSNTHICPQSAAKGNSCNFLRPLLLPPLQPCFYGEPVIVREASTSDSCSFDWRHYCNRWMQAVGCIVEFHVLDYGSLSETTSGLCPSTCLQFPTPQAWSQIYSLASVKSLRVLWAAATQPDYSSP